MSQLELNAALHANDERFRVGQPVRGVVSTVSPEQELVFVDAYGEPGRTPIAVRHPYLGVNSWMRVMPESGTYVMTQMSGTPKQMEISGYLSHKVSSIIQDARTKDEFIFRQLEEGTMEIMSVGRAYTHWGADGNLDQRGGVVEASLSQSDLEHRGRAPTFRRQLDLHDPAQLAHEERFGVVKRPDAQRPASAQTFIVDSNDDPRVEYSRWVNEAAGKEMAVLQEGHVVNASGTLQNQSKTGKELRYRRTVYHETAGELRTEIDKGLNLALVNTSTAAQLQTDVSLGITNAVKLSAKKLTIDMAQSGDFRFVQTFSLTAPQIALVGNVGFGGSFGAGGSEPLVKGTSLINNSLLPLLQTVGAALITAGADPALNATAPIAANTFKTAGPAIIGLAANLPSALSGKATVL
jgi:hypothetical protein